MTDVTVLLSNSDNTFRPIRGYLINPCIVSVALPESLDSEEDANKAILENQIEDGDVIVIRYEGPLRLLETGMKF